MWLNYIYIIIYGLYKFHNIIHTFELFLQIEHVSRCKMQLMNLMCIVCYTIFLLRPMAGPTLALPHSDSPTVPQWPHRGPHCPTSHRGQGSVIWCVQAIRHLKEVIQLNDSGLAGLVFCIKCLMPVSEVMPVLQKFIDVVNPGSRSAGGNDFDFQGDDCDDKAEAENLNRELVHMNRGMRRRLFFSVMSRNPSQAITLLGAAKVTDYNALVAYSHTVSDYLPTSETIRILQPATEVDIDKDCVLITPTTFTHHELKSLIAFDMKDTLVYSFGATEVPEDLTGNISDVAASLLPTISTISVARGVQPYALSSARDPDGKISRTLKFLESKGFAICNGSELVISGDASPASTVSYWVMSAFGKESLRISSELTNWRRVLRPRVGVELKLCDVFELHYKLEEQG